VGRFAQAARRHGVVWVLIVGSHLCVVGLLMHHYAARRSALASEPLQVMLLVLPDRRQTPLPDERPRASRHVPQAIPHLTPMNITPVPVPGAAASASTAPTIDWREEARTVTAAQALTPPPPRVCGEDELPDPRRPNCRKAPHDFEWHAEMPRVGIDGLIPYVRIGDTCVVGLGFFGCHEKMPANSRLFDGMKNRDAAVSSVPDTPN